MGALDSMASEASSREEEFQVGHIYTYDGCGGMYAHFKCVESSKTAYVRGSCTLVYDGIKYEFIKKIIEPNMEAFCECVQAGDEVILVMNKPVKFSFILGGKMLAAANDIRVAFNSLTGRVLSDTEVSRLLKIFDFDIKRDSTESIDFKDKMMDEIREHMEQYGGSYNGHYSWEERGRFLMHLFFDWDVAEYLSCLMYGNNSFRGLQLDYTGTELRVCQDGVDVREIIDKLKSGVKA